MNRIQKFKTKSHLPSLPTTHPFTPNCPTASKPTVGDPPNPHTVDDPPNPPTFPMPSIPPYFQCPNPLAQHHPTIANLTYYTPATKSQPTKKPPPQNQLNPSNKTSPTTTMVVGSDYSPQNHLNPSNKTTTGFYGGRIWVSYCRGGWPN